MRFLGLLTLWPGFVLAQGWIEYVDESGRFSVNLPVSRRWRVSFMIRRGFITPAGG